MKRLTTYICGYPHGAKGVSEDKLTGTYCRGSFEATAIVERLAAIEDILGDNYDLDWLSDLIEANKTNRCIVMPCKVGDAIYTIEQEFNGFSIEPKIEKRFIDGYSGNLLNPIWFISKRPYEMHYFLSEFGKTVFLTLEEAEAALKKMHELQRI